MVMGTGCVKHNKADLGVVCCKAQDGGGGVRFIFTANNVAEFNSSPALHFRHVRL